MSCPAPHRMRSPTCSSQIGERVATYIVLETKQLTATDINNELPLRSHTKCSCASTTHARSGVIASHVSLHFCSEVEFKRRNSRRGRDLHWSDVAFSQSFHEFRISELCGAHARSISTIPGNP